MTQTRLSISVGFIALTLFSGCATEPPPEPVAEEIVKCRSTETLTCDEFAGETYNCSCETSDNLRDILDAYRLPDY